VKTTKSGYLPMALLRWPSMAGFKVATEVQVCHIESYVTKTGKRSSRASLQHDIGVLWGFLQVLGSNGKAPHALASQPD
jgi:hypothetical protein